LQQFQLLADQLPLFFNVQFSRFAHQLSFFQRICSNCGYLLISYPFFNVFAAFQLLAHQLPFNVFAVIVAACSSVTLFNVFYGDQHLFQLLLNAFAALQLLAHQLPFSTYLQQLQLLVHHLFFNVFAF
jgi:hypothetical protein